MFGCPVVKGHVLLQTFVELEKVELESDRGMILNPIVGPEPITGVSPLLLIHPLQSHKVSYSYPGSSRMKGGSMTAILLDIIFITALSRACAISLDKLLSPTQGARLDNTLPLEPDIKNGEPTPLPRSNPCAVNDSGLSPDRMVSSLSRGQLEVATIVDAFAATYNAAYRSA